MVRQPIQQSRREPLVAEDLEAGLQCYFAFYNHERPHQSLNYAAPGKVHQGMVALVCQDGTLTCFPPFVVRYMGVTQPFVWCAPVICANILLSNTLVLAQPVMLELIHWVWVPRPTARARRGVWTSKAKSGQASFPIEPMR